LKFPAEIDLKDQFQEAAIGMKMGEDERRLGDDKIQWDGHTSSAEATARAARANITLNDQVTFSFHKAYHRKYFCFSLNFKKFFSSRRVVNVDVVCKILCT
jgi:hypothetical protein